MTFFNKIKDSAGSMGDLQESILGPDYKYYKYIKSPAEMGMSSKGTLETLGKNIKGLMSYTQLLVSGSGNASATGKPLGNKFFMETGATCSDVETNSTVNRSIYIDNVPGGNIPFLTSGTGVQFTTFSGLIPGTLENITRINPIRIFTTFTSGANPKCRAITMEVIDKDNKSSFETKYITEDDISDIPACSFLKKDGRKINPVTEVQCREGFTTSGRSGSFGSNSGRNIGRRTSNQKYSYSTPVPIKRENNGHESKGNTITSKPYEIGHSPHTVNEFYNGIEEIEEIEEIEVDNELDQQNNRDLSFKKNAFSKLTPEIVVSNKNRTRVIIVPEEIIKDNNIISKSGFPDDIYVKIYFSALGLFGLYLLTKMVQKQGSFRIK